MFEKTATALLLACTLAGCSSLIANATGPEPLGSAPGERTMAMGMEDWSIEKTLNVNLLKADPEFKNANIDVISFYGSVLLTGQVPTAELKSKAEQVARQIAEVKNVHNELAVEPATYYLSRAGDKIIRTKAWSKMKFDNTYPSSRTEIAVSNGVVYLMGKLTRAEADKAVEKISSVTGVQKIVKIVDYLPDAEPEQPQTPPAS